MVKRIGIRAAWQGCSPDLNDTVVSKRETPDILRAEAIEAIYTSDLSRAADRGQVGDALGVIPSPDIRLRELDIGVFQGLTLDEIKQRHPQDYAAFMDEPMTCVLPAGESRHMLQARVMAAWHDVVGRSGVERIVIVTHGGAVKMLLGGLFPPKQAEFQSMDIPNTSITVLKRDGTAWEIHDLANVTHLGGKDSSDKDTGVYF